VQAGREQRLDRNRAPRLPVELDLHTAARSGTQGGDGRRRYAARLRTWR
jgi:hypothetical protein